MAKVAFLRAEGDTVREKSGGRAGFRDIALFGGGAVPADIADGLRRYMVSCSGRVTCVPSQLLAKPTISA